MIDMVYCFVIGMVFCFVKIIILLIIVFDVLIIGWNNNIFCLEVWKFENLNIKIKINLFEVYF